jgi:hypothetical protein
VAHSSEQAPFTWVCGFDSCYGRMWKESVYTLPKVVGFLRVLRFPPKGKFGEWVRIIIVRKVISHLLCIHLFQLKLSPEQSGKVEYERKRLLGIANKFIYLLAIPSSLSRSYSTFPLCSGDNLNWNSCIYMHQIRYRLWSCGVSPFLTKISK